MHHQLSDTALLCHATLSLLLASRGLTQPSGLTRSSHLLIPPSTSTFLHNMLKSEPKKVRTKTLLKDLFEPLIWLLGSQLEHQTPKIYAQFIAAILVLKSNISEPHLRLFVYPIERKR